MQSSVNPAQRMNWALGIINIMISASATGGVTAAAISDTETIKVGSGSRFRSGGVGGGLLMMTQKQLLNQPSLSMLISSILFLMN